MANHRVFRSDAVPIAFDGLENPSLCAATYKHQDLVSTDAHCENCPWSGGISA